MSTLSSVGDWVQNTRYNLNSGRLYKGSPKQVLDKISDPANIFGIAGGVPAPAAPAAPAPAPTPAAPVAPVPDDAGAKTQAQIAYAKKQMLSGRMASMNPGGGGQAEKLG